MDKNPNFPRELLITELMYLEKYKIMSHVRSVKKVFSYKLCFICFILKHNTFNTTINIFF